MDFKHLYIISAFMAEKYHHRQIVLLGRQTQQYLCSAFTRWALLRRHGLVLGTWGVSSFFAEATPSASWREWGIMLFPHASQMWELLPFP